MRSQTSYLVVMMCMMGVFAVVRFHPFGLLSAPGNLIVGAALLFGGLFLAFRRVFSLAIPTGAALIAMVGGLLTFAKVRGFELPGFPLLWLIIGLYIEMRLVLHHQTLRRQSILLAQKKDSEKRTSNPQDVSPSNPPKEKGPDDEPSA